MRPVFWRKLQVEGGQFFRTQISWTQIENNVVLQIVVQYEAMHRFGGRLAPVGKKRFKEDSVERRWYNGDFVPIGTMGIFHWLGTPSVGTYLEKSKLE